MQIMPIRETCARSTSQAAADVCRMQKQGCKGRDKGSVRRGTHQVLRWQRQRGPHSGHPAHLADQPDGDLHPAAVPRPLHAGLAILAGYQPHTASRVRRMLQVLKRCLRTTCNVSKYHNMSLGA
jgi:hypothetical protein